MHDRDAVLGGLIVSLLFMILASASVVVIFSLWRRFMPARCSHHPQGARRLHEGRYQRHRSNLSGVDRGWAHTLAAFGISFDMIPRSMIEVLDFVVSVFTFGSCRIRPWTFASSIGGWAEVAICRLHCFFTEGLDVMRAFRYVAFAVACLCLQCCFV